MNETILMFLLKSIFAGNKISTQTGIGTGIAIAGVAMYSIIKAKIEEEKRVSSFFTLIVLQQKLKKYS